MAQAKVPQSMEQRAEVFLYNAQKAGISAEDALKELQHRVDNVWPQQIEEQNKAQEELAKKFRSDAKTEWREANPVKAGVADVLHGMTTIPRGALNIAGRATGTGKLGNKIFPADVVDTSSLPHLAGEIADPSAWIGGAKAYQGGAKAVSMLPKIGKIKILPDVGGAALSGGVIGGLNSPDDVAAGLSTGAGIGVLMAPVPWAIKKTASGVYNLGQGAKGTVENFLSDVFHDKNIPIKAITTMKPTLHGHTPTLSEAGILGASGDKTQPIAELIALENMARSRPTAANKLLAIDRANEAIRANILDDIAAPGRPATAFLNESKVLGKKPTKLSPAELNRQRQTSQLYAQAKDDLVPNVMLPRNVADPDGATSISELQKVKAELDSAVRLLSERKNKVGLDAKEANDLRELTKTVTALNEAMRVSSPPYAGAQDKYKRLSIPYNQAVVADELFRSLQSPAGVERYASFLNAWRNAPQTIMKKEGVPRYSQMTEVFSPNQMGLLGAVKEELEREAIASATRSPQTLLPKMTSPVEEAQRLIPSLIDNALAATRRAMSVAGKSLDKNAEVLLDNLIADPNAFVKFLGKLSPNEKAAVIQNFVDRGKSGAISALTNAAITERE